jgi:hypothetical protein
MFKEYDRNASYLLPPSIEEWLPSDHLARFISEITQNLDISVIINSSLTVVKKPMIQKSY